MRFGVVVFPGSNCDHDAWYSVTHNLGQQAEFLWHGSERLGNVDAVILPGGFAYGDYLRCGAIAKFSPIMKAVRKFAADGGLVAGICNGFQILTECGLLPGALTRNRGLKFICAPVGLRLESTNSPFTCSGRKGQILTIPIAHGEVVTPPPGASSMNSRPRTECSSAIPATRTAPPGISRESATPAATSSA